MTWQEAMTFAWRRHAETGWRWRVYAYRAELRGGRETGWRYTAVRAGRRKARS